MTLGNKIAQLRKAQSITQEALAQKLEVTNQAVSKWEGDQCCPDIQLLPKLADIFSISIDELFDREAPKPAPQTVDSLPWPDDHTLRAVFYLGQQLVGSHHAQKGLHFRYDGDVNGIYADMSVQCGNVTGSVDAAGNVTCGNVEGNVDAGTYVECGHVNGSIDAGTDVNCSGDVHGAVDAGCNVTCGNVDGDVDAGCNVTCKDVSGDVDAGTNVTCWNVGGDVDAGVMVNIKK